MRKLFIAILMFFSLVSFCQVGYLNAGYDTLKGVDTLYHQTTLLKQASGFIQFQIAADILAGTPTGYSVLQASVTGNKWATLTTVDYTVYTTSNDTMNYDTYGVNIWGMSGLPFNYFRSMNVGTTGDTLIIKSDYATKKY